MRWRIGLALIAIVVVVGTALLLTGNLGSCRLASVVGATNRLHVVVVFTISPTNLLLIGTLAAGFLAGLTFTDRSSAAPTSELAWSPKKVLTSSADRPIGLTPICIVAYLALYGLCRGTISHDYCFTIFRVFFLLALGLLLAFRGNAQAIGHYYIGRLALPREELPRLPLLLMAMVVGRAAADLLSPNLQTAFSRREAFDICIAAPISEEIVFRGVFLAILLAQPGIARWQAILLSALVFTSTHNFTGVGTLVTVSMLGVLTGIAYVCMRSVFVCIVCHAIWNAFDFWPANVWLSGAATV